MPSSKANVHKFQKVLCEFIFKRTLLDKYLYPKKQASDVLSITAKEFLNPK